MTMSSVEELPLRPIATARISPKRAYYSFNTIRTVFPSKDSP